MFENFMSLLAAGMIPVYTDTDSVYIVKKKGVVPPINIGSAFLEFEDENPGEH